MNDRLNNYMLTLLNTLSNFGPEVSCEILLTYKRKNVIDRKFSFSCWKCNEISSIVQQIIARNASNFLSNFYAIFWWKFAKRKKEIRPFHLHYFCIKLYFIAAVFALILTLFIKLNKSLTQKVDHQSFLEENGWESRIWKPCCGPSDLLV